MKKKLPVSIHAPARGAMYSPRKIQRNTSFNSRTREGCDLRITLVRVTSRFQFTHPRGVRFEISLHGRILDVSIHAPARGAM